MLTLTRYIMCVILNLQSSLRARLPRTTLWAWLTAARSRPSVEGRPARRRRRSCWKLWHREFQSLNRFYKMKHIFLDWVLLWSKLLSMMPWKVLVWTQGLAAMENFQHPGAWRQDLQDRQSPLSVPKFWISGRVSTHQQQKLCLVSFLKLLHFDEIHFHLPTSGVRDDINETEIESTIAILNSIHTKLVWFHLMNKCLITDELSVKIWILT